MKRIGIISTAYKSNDKYGMDFSHFQRLGYNCFDYQDFISSKSKVYQMSDDEFSTYFSELKNEAQKYGLTCSQLHMLWDIDAEETRNEHFISYYIKAIKAAALLGCPYCVLHPVSPVSWRVSFTKEEITKSTIELVEQLIPYCKKYNVGIAIENLPFAWIPDFFSVSGTLELINKINSPYVNMCVDIGHFNIIQEPIYETIFKVGGKLKVLHVHDNDGKSDLHMFPGDGIFDYSEFLRALKDINFAGVISLETRAKDEALPIDEYEKEDIRLNNIVKKIASY